MTDLNTEYRYNIDKKLMRITFKDGDSTLFYIHYDDGDIALTTHSQQVISPPTWGTNKDINEWFSHVLSCQGRLGLTEGVVRPNYSRTLVVDNDGVDGTLTINNKTISDYSWVDATDTLTIAARTVAADASVAEFRLYLQWLYDFKHCVVNFGA